MSDTLYMKAMEILAAENEEHVGFGYRLLGPDELVREGDQFQSKNGHWLVTGNHISDKGRQSRGYRYRRWVGYGDNSTEEKQEKMLEIQYRMLDEDEPLQEGDEWYEKVSGEWKPSVNWKRGRQRVSSLQYRRPVIK